MRAVWRRFTILATVALSVLTIVTTGQRGEAGGRFSLTPEHRAMTAEEFLGDLRQRLPHIADRQASALAGLGGYSS